MWRYLPSSTEFRPDAPQPAGTICRPLVTDRPGEGFVCSGLALTSSLRVSVKISMSFAHPWKAAGR